VQGAVRIDNSGPREEAGERLVALLRKAIAAGDVAGTV
jgi:ribose 1,5-bisphosphokinase PhnN